MITRASWLALVVCLWIGAHPAPVCGSYHPQSASLLKQRDGDRLRALFERVLHDHPAPDHRNGVRVMKLHDAMSGRWFYLYVNQFLAREFWYYPSTRELFQKDAGRKVVPPERQWLARELEALDDAAQSTK